MNTETLEKMKKMRLLGMHRAFQTSLQTPRPESLTMDEMIAQLIDSEWDDRHNRSIDRSMKRARFRYNATLENLDYAPGRGIDKNQIHRFADGSFIKQNENHGDQAVCSASSVNGYAESSSIPVHGTE